MCNKEKFKKNCLVCNKEFRCESNSQYNRRNYCSRECVYRKKEIFTKEETFNLICSKCNKDFIVKNIWHYRNKKFCHECHPAKREIVTKSCVICESFFEHRDSPKNSSKNTCSIKCCGINRKRKNLESVKHQRYQVCTKCKINKEYHMFSKDKYKIRGIKEHCKKCCSEFRASKNNSPITVGNKTCSKCGVTHNINYFPCSKTANDGRKSNCTKCIYSSSNIRVSKSPYLKLVRNLRSRIRHAMNAINSKKLDKSINLLGCTIAELKLHLERQFSGDMNWANYGKLWVVDHYIPVSAYNLLLLSNQQKAFYYANLCPLGVIENLIKGAKLPENFTMFKECENNE